MHKHTKLSTHKLKIVALSVSLLGPAMSASAHDGGCDANLIELHQIGRDATSAEVGISSCVENLPANRSMEGTAFCKGRVEELRRRQDWLVTVIQLTIAACGRPSLLKSMTEQSLQAIEKYRALKPPTGAEPVEKR
jgi:hypothetical protein